MTQILSRVKLRLLLSNCWHLQVFLTVCSEIWLVRSYKNCHVKATGRFCNRYRLEYSFEADCSLTLGKPPEWFFRCTNVKHKSLTNYTLFLEKNVMLLFIQIKAFWTVKLSALCQYMAFFQLVLSKPLSACFLFIRMRTVIFGKVKVIQVNLFESCLISSKWLNISDDNLLEYHCI